MNIDYTPDNTVIFTIARMNPPTPGHLSLIEKLINVSVEKNANKVYVILSNTNNNNENPIACSEKLNVLGNFENESKSMIKVLKQQIIDKSSPELEDKIKNTNVKLICVPEESKGNIFSVISQITNIPSQKSNVIVIVGEDRKNFLDKIFDFLSKKSNFNSLDGVIMERTDMEKYKTISKNISSLKELNISTVPIDAFSASFVRNIVKHELYDKFSEIYSPYLDDKKIENLYNKISEGLKLPENKAKPEKEVTLKYKYPKLNETYREDKQEDNNVSNKRKTSKGINISNKRKKMGGKNKLKTQRKTKKNKKK